MNPQDPYSRPQPAAPQPMPVPTQPPMGPPSVPPQMTAPAPTPQPVQYPQPLGDLQTQQPANPYPTDYLDTIAAPQPQKTMNKFLLFAMIGGIIVAAVLAVIMLSSLGKKPDFSTQSAAVSERIATLQAVVDEHQKHLTDNRLRVTNATLSATLTTMSKDLTTIMTERGLKPTTKVSVTETAYETKLQETLNDAYLLGSLDRSYPSEMAYQLSLLKTQLRRLKLQANNETVDDFYDTSLASIEQVSKEFSDFIGDK